MTAVILSALAAHWRRHPLQLATLVLGLALATALWSGVQAINGEARRSYDAAAGSVGQDPLDRLTGPDVTLADFVALRRAGWQVSPVVEGRLGPLRIRGIDPLSAPPQAGLSGFVEGDVDLGAFVTAPGMLLVAPETVARIGALDLPHLVVPDVAPNVVLTDIAVAQHLLGVSGFSHLVIARDQVAGLAPLDQITTLTRSTPADTGDLAQLTDSFHLNLTAFGFLAFAVGLFIVQSAIGLAFEQRRTTFRTLRALGVGLRQLLVLLGVELAAVAVISGALGLVLGYAIAAALLPGVSGTLRSLYGAQISGALDFDPMWAISAMAMTVLGAAAAGGLALWRVAKLPLLAPAQPRAWARASHLQLRVQRWAALGLLALAGVLAVFGNSLISGFACLGALLLGAALLLPGLLIAVLDLLGRRVRNVLGEWLLADARQQVPALSLALMALLLALAANIGVGTMVGSFRTTFTGWLDQRLASELYLTARNGDEAEEIRSALEGRADAVLPIWSVEGQVAGQPAEIFGIVTHETYRDNWPLIATSEGAWDRVAAGDGALINEQLARRSNIWPGDDVSLGAGWEMPVVAVYSDYGNPNAQAIVGFDGLRARAPDVPVLRYALRVDPVEAAALKEALIAEFDLPEGAIVDQADVKALSLRIFEQTFLVTGALNVLTLAVAGFAILTSLLTLSTMRISQLAPVWALGLTPARLARFELARTAILAGLTWVLAVPVGLALAWVLLSVVNVHAFGWRLPMMVFPGDWVRLIGWALVAAVLAGLWPALRLLRGGGALLLRRFANDR